MAKIHKCGLYIRVSTEEQALVGEGGSLPSQRKRLERLILEKKRTADEFQTGDEWITYKVYEEQKSAKDTNRPKYQEMLDDIEAENVNTLLFTELSRLSRSTKDFLGLCDYLVEKGVEVVCLQNPGMDLASPPVRAMMTMIVTMMEFERGINVDRSRHSFQSRAGQGYWTGGQILGYDLDEKKKGYLTVNPVEKKIINFIFDTYAETGSIDEVVKRTRQHGYKTKCSKSRREKEHTSKDFCYSSIKHILTNPAYVSQRELGKPRRVKGSNGKWRLEESSVKRQIINTDKWLPIVTQAKFNEIQDMLAQSRRSRMPVKPSKGEHIFLLGQTVFCTECREMLTHGGTQKPSGVIPYYTHRKGKQAGFCTLPPNINARRLDEAIWERVSQNLNTADLQRWTKEAIEAERSIGTDAIQAKIAEIQKALKAKSDSHRNILQGFQDGAVDAETRTVLSVMSGDIGALRIRLAETKKEFAAAKQYASSNKAKSPVRLRAMALKDLDAAQRRDLLKMLIHRVELTPNSIVLNPFEGDPIVGEVKERKGVRSGRWRFIDVEWLN